MRLRGIHFSALAPIDPHDAEAHRLQQKMPSRLVHRIWEQLVQGDDREVQEQLFQVDAAFASTCAGQLSASDEKLLALLKQLIHEHPHGFFLMHGEALAYEHRKLEVFKRSGRQEDLRRFQADLTEAEIARLRTIQQRVALALYESDEKGPA